MKTHWSLPAALSLVPLAGFLWLIFYAYVARLQVGHWPVYGRPDPTDIRPWLAGYALMGILIGFVFASPAALAALSWVSACRVIHSKTAREKVRQSVVWTRHLVVFALGAWLFAIALLDLREWLLD